LDDEKQTSEKLNELALGEVNEEAMTAVGAEEKTHVRLRPQCFAARGLARRAATNRSLDFGPCMMGSRAHRFTFTHGALGNHQDLSAFLGEDNHLFGEFDDAPARVAVD